MERDESINEMGRDPQYEMDDEQLANLEGQLWQLYEPNAEEMIAHRTPREDSQSTNWNELYE